MIDKHKPHKWNGVPTMVQDLMEHPDFDKYGQCQTHKNTDRCLPPYLVNSRATS